MRLALLLLLCALSLAGCSGMRVVESQVRTSTAPEGAPIPQGATYRFEHLPSQTDPVENDSIDAIVEAELNEVGLVHDQAQARYSVQVSTSLQSYLVDDFGRPYTGPRVGGSISIGVGNARSPWGPWGPWNGGMFGMGANFPPSTRHRHEVVLIMRDLRSQQIVYETRATHEGPWNDRYNILRALLAAALKDYPQPSSGPHTVKVEIPR